jgi:hypothetical protein
MTRGEIEKTVEPIIRECLRKFGDYSRPEISPEEFDVEIADELRPDVRRVSLLVSLTKSVAGDEFAGEGLELGCGYGYVLFPHGEVFPQGSLDGNRAPEPPLLRTP